MDAVPSAKYWLYSLNSFPTAKLRKAPDRNSTEGLTAMKEKIQKSFVTESNTKVFTQFGIVTSQNCIRSYDSLMSSFELLETSLVVSYIITAEMNQLFVRQRLAGCDVIGI